VFDTVAYLVLSIHSIHHIAMFSLAPPYFSDFWLCSLIIYKLSVSCMYCDMFDNQLWLLFSLSTQPWSLKHHSVNPKFCFCILEILPALILISMLNSIKAISVSDLTSDLWIPLSENTWTWVWIGGIIRQPWQLVRGDIVPITILMSKYFNNGIQTIRIHLRQR